MVPYRVILGKQKLKGCGDNPRIQDHGHHLVLEGWGKHYNTLLNLVRRWNPSA